MMSDPSKIATQVGDLSFDLIASSSAMIEALNRARRFAQSSCSVLIIGATGTGKELVARAVHEWSGRTGPFVDVNCGALPHDLIEGMLFGRRKGAFTGAHDTAVGLIESSHGGTLFLDELSSLPSEGQVKLLRTVETREVRRVGDLTNRSVDLRVVAAVQDDVSDKVDRGVFRADLLQRVAGIAIAVPPLAERPDDLLPLAEYFACRAGKQLGPGVQLVLERYPWPGNVRELEATIARGAVLSDGPFLSSEVVAESIHAGAALIVQDGLWANQSREADRSELRRICEAHKWKAKAIAKELGIGRTTLFRRLRAAGISLRN